MLLIPHGRIVRKEQSLQQGVVCFVPGGILMQTKSDVSASAAGILLLLGDGLLLQGKSFGGLQLLLFLQYLGDQLIEGNCSTIQRLGTSFDVDNPNFRCNFSRLILVHLPHLLEIVLVAHQQQVDPPHVGLLTDLLDPEVDHFEGLTVADVEHQEDAVHVPVVVGSNRVVPRRTSRVPDLHPHRAAVLEFQRFLLVLDPDCGGVVGAELLVHVLGQQRALPHVALPNYQQFHPHLIFSCTHRLYQTTPNPQPPPQPKPFLAIQLHL